AHAFGGSVTIQESPFGARVTPLPRLARRSGRHHHSPARSLRSFLSASSLASCSEMRCDRRSSSEAPEYDVACSTSSRRLLRTMAMRLSMSATADATSGAGPLGGAVPVLGEVFCSATAAGRALRDFWFFLAAGRLLRLAAGLSAPPPRPLAPLFGRAPGSSPFPAFLAAGLFERDFDAAMFPPAARGRKTHLPYHHRQYLRHDR